MDLPAVGGQVEYPIIQEAVELAFLPMERLDRIQQATMHLPELAFPMVLLVETAEENQTEVLGVAVPQPGVAVAVVATPVVVAEYGHIRAVQIGVMEAAVVAHSTPESIKTILPG